MVYKMDLIAIYFHLKMVCKMDHISIYFQLEMVYKMDRCLLTFSLVEQTGNGKSTLEACLVVMVLAVALVTAMN